MQISKLKQVQFIRPSKMWKHICYWSDRRDHFVKFCFVLDKRLFKDVSSFIFHHFRKAKRAARAHSISEEGKFGTTYTGAGKPHDRNMKNSRKSRSGLGRGLPKKGELKCKN